MDRRRGWATTGIWVLGLASAAGCGSAREKTTGIVSVDAAVRPSIAHQTIADLQARFILKPVATLPHGGAGLQVEPQPKEVPLIRRAAATRIVREGRYLRPEIPDHARIGTMKRAAVRLSEHANGGFELRDVESKMEIRVAMQDATDASGEEAGGYVLYRAGHRAGGHVVHRPHIEGTEDYVVFHEKPEREELRYRVTLGDGVAGLRLVSNVLEFLDAGGAPRLRMTAPHAVDSRGDRVELTIGVAGCALDLDPRMPWGRAVTAAGAEECGVTVGWKSAVYPVAVDPAWATTGSMATARYMHTANVLLSGRVLVAGGVGAGGSLAAAAELYDSTTGVWTAAGTLATGRQSHTATLLQNGAVIATGGYSAGIGALASCERYDPNANTWAAVASLATSRELHSASALSNGNLLVAGGVGASGYLASSELYSPTSNAWTAGPSLAKARTSQTATLLANGKVLVVGGTGLIDPNTSTYGPIASPELYDSTANTWAAAGTMSPGRVSHTATLLSDGSLIVAGGSYSGGRLNLVQRYDPVSNAWTARANLVEGRQLHTASVLSTGRVLVAGGYGTARLATVELYDPIGNTWSTEGSLTTARESHTASVLPNGKVLVVGGYNGSVLASAEVWMQQPEGGTCSQPADCTSGFCVTGVCCAQPCSATGEGCALTWTGLANGTCGLKKVGLSCVASAECASGTCIDSVCCGTTCAQPCYACSQARTGQSDGTCGPVPANNDPRGDCTLQGTGTCQTSGLCDGAGACQTKAGTVCGTASCATTSLQPAPTCDAVGNCVTGSAVSCGAYKCSAAACLTSCATSSDCQSPYQCVNGRCGTGNGTGISCSSASECTSGYCVEGVCCNEACGDACRSCLNAKSGGTTGICSSIVGGADPKVIGGCTVSGNACGSDGKCDGSGACRTAAPRGKSCGSSVCTGDSVAGQICDGAGACQASGGTSCSPFGCTAGTCRTTCTTSSECAAGFTCIGGSCGGKRANGEACTAADQCVTGFCADGFCCDQACTGACLNCAGINTRSGQDGKCESTKAGTNPRGGCAHGTLPCGADATCDGAGACRAYATKGMSCGATTCVGDSVAGQICDGAGTCSTSSGSSCSPFGCLNGACRTTCGVSTECATGYVCIGGACAPRPQTEKRAPAQTSARRASVSTGCAATVPARPSAKAARERTRLRGRRESATR